MTVPIHNYIERGIVEFISPQEPKHGTIPLFHNESFSHLGMVTLKITINGISIFMDKIDCKKLHTYPENWYTLVLRDSMPKLFFHDTRGTGTPNDQSCEIKFREIKPGYLEMI